MGPLLRSAITILAYLFAMPIAVAATSLLAPQIGGKFAAPPDAESAAILRNLPDHRHGARKAGAPGARRPPSGRKPVLETASAA
jgi:hypothetical protein